MGKIPGSNLYSVFSNPIYLNPALAGSSGCPRVSLNYRNEWPQLTGNYVTYSAAFDTYSKGIQGGIGLIAMHDQQGQGTITTSMLSGIYSYNLKVNRKFSFMFGARAAWFQKFLDWDKLTFGDMIDPRRGSSIKLVMFQEETDEEVSLMHQLVLLDLVKTFTSVARFTILTDQMSL